MLRTAGFETVRLKEAREVLRPDAERYGSWYAQTSARLSEWLRGHSG